MIATVKVNLLERVDAALECVRPHLKADGGDVELVDITEDFVARIKWLGACRNCNMTQMTMKAGLEEAVKNQVKEIVRIEAVN